MTTRKDLRSLDELRNVTITPRWQEAGEGSCLVEFGKTRVLCTASFTEGVPRWKQGSGEGWVTAEYAMLPRATDSRSPRESVKGKIGGRTHEISRLIGRSLRAVVDMSKLGENSIVLDCDVLQADGGTRTASISGACVALVDAFSHLLETKKIKDDPLTGLVGAVSVGVYKDEPVLDLDYAEDSNAGTDMNVVMTQQGGFIEIQGSAEGAPFTREQSDTLLGLAEKGIGEIIQAQQQVLGW